MSRRGDDRDRRGSSNVSLYVRHIADTTRPDDLRRVFEKYGPIKDIYIPMDYYTRRARGFAYVEYEDPRDAKDAMHELDRFRMNGREIEIEFAIGDRKTSHQMRRKYGADDAPAERSRDRPRDRDRRRRSRSRSHDRAGKERGGERQRRSRSRSGSRSKSREGKSRERDTRQKRGRSESRSESPVEKPNNGKEKERRSDGAESDYTEETAE
uniref:RRM domain-containing protein n=1 Tax=Plectus sambesii TaxID=2011161 RepID=A0A914WIS7_9BILA